jgi:hypothetical protein
VTNATSPRHGKHPLLALTCVSGPVTLGIPQLAPTDIRGAGLTLSLGKAVAVMAKALFGHVVAPAELRVVEENAILRAKVRRLEQELEELRAQRDAAIAHELLSMAGNNPEPALA